MVVGRPPAPKPSPPPEKRIVVIDPGHGGVDPGAVGSAMKILEKNVGVAHGPGVAQTAGGDRPLPGDHDPRTTIGSCDCAIA